MQLTIDLSDRTAIAAAVSLLQLVIAGVPEATAPACIRPEDNPAAGQETGAPFAPLAPARDSAAAVFGGAPAALPAGAVPLAAPGALPSAGAPQSPSAPVAALGGLPGLPSAARLPVPPLVPAASAPQANATAASPAGGVEIDAEGLPWDERIHAGTKTKNANGRWKARKGLNDPARVTAVKQELLAHMGNAPQAPAAPTAPPAPPANVPALPITQAPPGPLPAPANFDEFAARAAAAMNAKVIPLQAVNDALTAHKLASMVQLKDYPDFCGHVWRYLQDQFPGLA